jgi:hypothetical protein
MGPYTWAYGTVSPEFITQVQSAMQMQGLTGSVHTSTFGEQNGNCGYGAMAVDYSFTVSVTDLLQGSDLAQKAAQVLEIARDFVEVSPAPNLGNLSLVFQGNDQSCSWTYREGAWNANMPASETNVLCPVPPSAESQKLEDALGLVSTALDCETSSITTNDIQSVLVCERPEGQNRYKLTATLRLNSTLGYTNTCFHGYQAYESSYTGDTPMTVTDSSGTYFERDRTFEWNVSNLSINLFEQIMGGEDVVYPEGIHEQVYQVLLQEGLIPGDGSQCP